MRPTVKIAALQKPIIHLRRVEYVGNETFQYRTKCNKIIPMQGKKKIGEGMFGTVFRLTFKNGMKVAVKDVDPNNDKEICILKGLNQVAGKNEYTPCGLVHGTVIYEDEMKAIVAMQVMDGSVHQLLNTKNALHAKDILKMVDKLIGMNMCLLRLGYVYTDMHWGNVLFKTIGKRNIVLGLGDFGGVGTIDTTEIGNYIFTYASPFPREASTVQEIDGVWPLWCTLCIGLLHLVDPDQSAQFINVVMDNPHLTPDAVISTLKQLSNPYGQMVMDILNEFENGTCTFATFRKHLRKGMKGGQTTPKPITPGFTSTTDLSKITISNQGKVFFDGTPVRKKKIGQGSYGKVFRVYKPEPFVLKEIAVKNSQRELAFLNAVARYEGPYQLLKQNIPCNMVNGRLVRKGDRYAYVAMDAMDDTLKALVRTTCLTSMEILNIALVTCRMLVCLKQLGYYYTDIKLKNMLYKESSDGAIYLVLGDYGSLVKEGEKRIITTIKHPNRQGNKVVSDRDVLYPFLWMIAKCFPRPKALTCQLTLTYPKGALQAEKKYIQYTNFQKERNWIFNSDYMGQKVPQRIAQYYGINGNLGYLNSKTLEDLERDLSEAVAEHVLSAGQEDDLAATMEGMTLGNPLESRVRKPVKRFEDEFQNPEDLSIELESASGDIDGSSGIESNSADEDNEGDLSMVVGDESMDQNSGDSREIEEAAKEETEEYLDLLSLVSDDEEPEPDPSNSRSVEEDTPGSLVDFIVDDDESLPSCFEGSDVMDEDKKGLEWARQKLQNIVNYDPCCDETGDSREIEEASERETTEESVGDLDYSWMYD
tara:strand:- start:5481 stop:7934 length:2454 start_codon:yes stop_codon:yes gene_type:complete